MASHNTMYHPSSNPTTNMEGLSCNNNLWEEAANIHEAQQQKRQAVGLKRYAEMESR